MLEFSYVTSLLAEGLVTGGLLCSLLWLVGYTIAKVVNLMKGV